MTPRTHSGPGLFARYAYPPNVLGYCGPDDHPTLLEHADDPAAAGDIAHLARQFEGAWPYLELIAAANRVRDPLDPRVVEAYWVGNALLDQVTFPGIARSFDDRFRRMAGRGWDRLLEGVGRGGLPHHSLHVFAVYPWIGMLRAGRSLDPLRVLDRCRIRCGRVVAVCGDDAVVTTRHLTWDGHRLTYLPPEPEVVRAAHGNFRFASDIQPGQWVSMHWDWVCDRLTYGQRLALEHYSAINLAAVNSTAGPPAILS